MTNMTNSDFQDHFTLSKITLNFQKIIGLKPNYFKKKSTFFEKMYPIFAGGHSSTSKNFKFLLKTWTVF